MSTHVLLNLLNELGKSDKRRGLSSVLSLFCNELNKFSNTGVRMLDLKCVFFVIAIFGVKMCRVCHKYAILLWASLHNVEVPVNL